MGADSIKRCHLTSTGNLIVEIRRSYGRLISTMRFPLLVRWHLYIESGPRVCDINIIGLTKGLISPDDTTMLCCRIWSWSPMLCEKHGPRDSVDKNRGRRPRFLSLLRPEGHVFHTAWETMIKSYYSTLTDLFFLPLIHMNMNFSPLNWAIFGSLHGC